MRAVQPGEKLTDKYISTGGWSRWQSGLVKVLPFCAWVPLRHSDSHDSVMGYFVQKSLVGECGWFDDIGELESATSNLGPGVNQSQNWRWRW